MALTIFKEVRHYCRTSFFLACLSACLLSAGCGQFFQPPREKAHTFAISHGWNPVHFNSNGFPLTGFMKRGAKTGGILRVYIEGDGFSWKNRYDLSKDPTPKDPVALRMAITDNGSNLFYLGRPCQYCKDIAEAPLCRPQYWSTHRYSSEIIDAMSISIDQVMKRTKAESVELVGFSGGGTVAALLSARRSDVVWFATVAANLDLQAWTSLHRVTPLNKSLNPADFIATLQAVPQIHFVGNKDKKVPEVIIRSYLDRMTDHSMSKIVLLPGFDHNCCWVEQWPTILKTYIRP